jgi:hypothetical protein
MKKLNKINLILNENEIIDTKWIENKNVTEIALELENNEIEYLD